MAVTRSGVNMDRIRAAYQLQFRPRLADGDTLRLLLPMVLVRRACASSYHDCTSHHVELLQDASLSGAVAGMVGSRSRSTSSS